MYTSLSSFRAPRLFAVGFVLIASGFTAQAQWTVTVLHPEGAAFSECHAADGENQAGRAAVGGLYRAGLWRGTAASWVDLNPEHATQSWATTVSDGRQAGWAEVGGIRRASLWNGSAESWVDLHQAGWTVSVIFGAGGGQQVGYVSDDEGRASLWSGTAASWVDLSPGITDLEYSEAHATDGKQQVGFYFDEATQRDHACVWSGTGTSMVDLHPFGSLGSIALAVSDGQQAGFVYVSGYNEHATLWSGTAASRVDLNPVGAIASMVYGMSAGQQVGWAWVDGVVRASLWSGTADSWEDLHQVLPDEFTRSRARAISNDGVHVYVAGYGTTTALTTKALLWTRPLCRADFNGDGFATGIDYDLYVQAFEAGEAAADFDGDGFITGIDFDLYVQAFVEGC